MEMHLQLAMVNCNTEPVTPASKKVKPQRYSGAAIKSYAILHKGLELSRAIRICTNLEADEHPEK